MIFILLSRNLAGLKQWQTQITQFLNEKLHLLVNQRATRVAPVSGGVDFAGFIVRPHYKLVRRRVVGNLKQKLERIESQLVKAQGDLVIYHFARELLRECQAMMNSYLSHFSHAKSKKLIWKIRQQFLFLNNYFILVGNKLILADKSLSELKRLRQQIKWVNKKYQDYYCLIQIGFYYEVFGEHAKSVAEMMGFRLQENWRGFRHSCGFPKWRLKKVEEQLQSRCIPYVIVHQTGRELYLAKDRLPYRMVEYHPRSKPNL